MSGQLSFHFPARLEYSADNYILHGGVNESFRGCLAALARDGFALIFGLGSERSEKTHFSIKLHAELSSRGRYPRLIEGRALSARIPEFLCSCRRDSGELLIVDGFEHYLRSVVERENDSGEFVALVENCRNRGVPLVILSSTPIEECNCDDHVKSRLRSAVFFQLESPDELDLPRLVQAMARQRGIHLSARKVEYLQKRIGRELRAIEELLESATYLAETIGEGLKFSVLSDALPETPEEERYSGPRKA